MSLVLFLLVAGLVGLVPEVRGLCVLLARRSVAQRERASSCQASIFSKEESIRTSAGRFDLSRNFEEKTDFLALYAVEFGDLQCLSIDFLMLARSEKDEWPKDYLSITVFLRQSFISAALSSAIAAADCRLGQKFLLLLLVSAAACGWYG